MKDIYDTLDALKDFGDLEFEPEWLTQTDSSGEVNGSCIFKNTSVDLACSKQMSEVRLTFSDGNTQTTTTTRQRGNLPEDERHR